MNGIHNDPTFMQLGLNHTITWCLASYCTKGIYLWLDLRQSVFHAHNSKIHFSPSHDSCTYYIANISGWYQCWKLPRLLCCGLFLSPVRYPRVLGWSLNGSISSGLTASLLWITTRLAGKVEHGCSCFVCYVELKIAPADVIWLFLLLHTHRALTHYFVALHHPLSGTPIGVLVVLAQPVNGGPFS